MVDLYGTFSSGSQDPREQQEQMRQALIARTTERTPILQSLLKRIEGIRINTIQFPIVSSAINNGLSGSLLGKRHSVREHVPVNPVLASEYRIEETDGCFSGSIKALVHTNEEQAILRRAWSRGEFDSGWRHTGKYETTNVDFQERLISVHYNPAKDAFWITPPCNYTTLTKRPVNGTNHPRIHTDFDFSQLQTYEGPDIMHAIELIVKSLGVLASSRAEEIRPILEAVQRDLNPSQNQQAPAKGLRQIKLKRRSRQQSNEPAPE